MLNLKDYFDDGIPDKYNDLLNEAVNVLEKCKNGDALTTKDRYTLYTLGTIGLADAFKFNELITMLPEL